MTFIANSMRSTILKTVPGRTTRISWVDSYAETAPVSPTDGQAKGLQSLYGCTLAQHIMPGSTINGANFATISVGRFWANHTQREWRTASRNGMGSLWSSPIMSARAQVHIIAICVRGAEMATAVLFALHSSITGSCNVYRTLSTWSRLIRRREFYVEALQNYSLFQSVDRNATVGIYPPVSREITSLAWCTHSCAELRLRCCDCPVSAHGIKGYPGTWPDLRSYIDLHESIDFCFSSIHAVHLTVYTVPSWWCQQLHSHSSQVQYCQISLQTRP